MSEQDSGKPINILLVEDSPGDVGLVKEAFADYKVRNQLDVLMNGGDALPYLRRQGAFAQAARPDLILLDLNLPKKDGRQVLAEIKNDPDLKRIPVVILTTSKAEEDILKSYDIGANAYLTKPVNLPQLLELVKSIEDFWMVFCRLPPN